MSYRGIFVTGTGTGVGKTFVATALCKYLCELLREQNVDVLGLKPIETGVSNQPEDAVALARACGRPELAAREGFYRARLPVAPWAATLAGEAALDLVKLMGAIETEVTQHVRQNASPYLLVEGAGGPLVPLTATEMVADLILRLRLATVVVARDTLGTLSHTFATCEALRSRGIEIAAVVVNRFGQGDESQDHNAHILRERLSVPVFDSRDLRSLATLLVEREYGREVR